MKKAILPNLKEYRRERGFHTIEHNLDKLSPGKPWKIIGYKRFDKKAYKVFQYIDDHWVLRLIGVRFINEIIDKIESDYPELFL